MLSIVRIVGGNYVGDGDYRGVSVAGLKRR